MGLNGPCLDTFPLCLVSIVADFLIAVDDQCRIILLAVMLVLAKNGTEPVFYLCNENKHLVIFCQCFLFVYFVCFFNLTLFCEREALETALCPKIIQFSLIYKQPWETYTNKIN